MPNTLPNYEALAKQVQQQEALITQLMSIIAVTNRKVHELSKADQTSSHNKKNYIHV